MVDVVVSLDGFVLVIKLAVVGLMVDLPVDVIFEVTFVATGTLAVVLEVVVCLVVSGIVVGSDFGVDTSRVMTVSWIVVGLLATSEILVDRG